MIPGAIVGDPIPNGPGKSNGVGRIDFNGSPSIDYAYLDDSFVFAVGCGDLRSNGVGPVLKVCTDLPYPGADPAAARAWVATALKSLPAGSTQHIRNPDLAGLHWDLYNDAGSTKPQILLTVGTQYVGLANDGVPN